MLCVCIFDLIIFLPPLRLREIKRHHLARLDVISPSSFDFVLPFQLFEMNLI